VRAACWRLLRAAMPELIVVVFRRMSQMASVSSTFMRAKP